MSADPLLSIILFTRNDAVHLRACLQSLIEARAELDPSFEVLIFDNASSDDSAARCEPLSEELGARWLRVEEETSFSRGNNAALAQARGRHVLFLNPDTLPSADVLAAGLAALDRDATIGLLSPCLRYPDGRYQPTGWALPTARTLLRDHLRGPRRQLPPAGPRQTEVGWLLGCFLLGPRRLLQEFGGFDEDFWFHGTDLEICARIWAAGYRVLRLEDRYLVHVGHEAWDTPRREASQGALLRYLFRDGKPLTATLLGAAARLRGSPRP